jgi:23S rRNA (uracil1939-C5)-methyltransferase
MDWPHLAITAPERRFGYRNKIEFSFYINDDDEINLSFFGRSSKRKLPIESCELALPVINSVGKYILAWIREQNIPFRSLKSLIIRGSQDGKAIAALFMKDKLQLELPSLNTQLVGMQLIYSTHKSPASVITEMLQSAGEQEMHETVAGVDFAYGPHSFFQVYVPVFEKALAAIARHVPEGAQLLDFYAGVGSIGLPLAQHAKHVTLVESNAEAVEFAKKNIVQNTIKNAQAYCAPAEAMTELITSDKILILDPPRAGLHEKVVQRILETRPPKVIYLSCNVSTQARDLQMLTNDYKLTSLELFNFFPATPHIEGLAVLET